MTAKKNNDDNKCNSDGTYKNGERDTYIRIHDDDIKQLFARFDNVDKEVVKLKSELRVDLVKLKSELQTDIGDVKSDVKGLKGQARVYGGVVGFLASVLVVIGNNIMNYFLNTK